MKRKMEELFAGRAEDLAFLHLTRRADLVVDRLHSPRVGVDFLVAVTRNGVSTGRMFGVQAQGFAGRVHTAGDLDRLIQRPHVSVVAEVPFPVCIFVFTMDDDRGFYGWMKEPVLGTRRSGALRTVTEGGWRELDPDGMVPLVRAVERWYEARDRSSQPSRGDQEGSHRLPERIGPPGS